MIDKNVFSETFSLKVNPYYCYRNVERICCEFLMVNICVFSYERVERRDSSLYLCLAPAGAGLPQ